MKSIRNYKYLCCSCLHCCGSKHGLLADCTQKCSAAWSKNKSLCPGRRFCFECGQFWIRPHSNSLYCWCWGFSDATQYFSSEYVAFSEMRNKNSTSNLCIIETISFWVLSIKRSSNKTAFISYKAIKWRWSRKKCSRIEIKNKPMKNFHSVSIVFLLMIANEAIRIIKATLLRKWVLKHAWNYTNV